MADCYLGEIRLFGGNFPPKNWAFCNGQLLNIADYQALYSLIGTTYGGDGVKTFAVPNLTGSAVVGAGQSPDDQTFNPPLGAVGGVETVTLTEAQVPAHTHALCATTGDATTAEPGPSVGFASVQAQGLLGYTDISSGLKPSATPAQLGTNAVGATGTTAPHDNMMPSLALNYIIALLGLFPQSA